MKKRYPNKTFLRDTFHNFQKQLIVYKNLSQSLEIKENLSKHWKIFMKKVNKMIIVLRNFKLRFNP